MTIHLRSVQNWPGNCGNVSAIFYRIDCPAMVPTSKEGIVHSRPLPSPIDCLSSICRTFFWTWPTPYWSRSSSPYSLVSIRWYSSISHTLISIRNSLVIGPHRSTIVCVPFVQRPPVNSFKVFSRIFKPWSLFRLTLSRLSFALKRIFIWPYNSTQQRCMRTSVR